MPRGGYRDAPDARDRAPVMGNNGQPNDLAARVTKLGAHGHGALWIDAVGLYRQSPDAVRGRFYGKVRTAIVAAATDLTTDADEEPHTAAGRTGRHTNARHVTGPRNREHAPLNGTE